MKKYILNFNKEIKNVSGKVLGGATLKEIVSHQLGQLSSKSSNVLKVMEFAQKISKDGQIEIEYLSDLNMLEKELEQTKLPNITKFVINQAFDEAKLNAIEKK